MPHRIGRAGMEVLRLRPRNSRKSSSHEVVRRRALGRCNKNKASRDTNGCALGAHVVPGGRARHSTRAAPSPLASVCWEDPVSADAGAVPTDAVTDATAADLHPQGHSEDRGLFFFNGTATT